LGARRAGQAADSPRMIPWGYIGAALAGLALGAALLIWGLGERSHRSAAEAKALVAERKQIAAEWQRDEAIATAEANVKQAADAESYGKRLGAEVEQLRIRLAEVRQRLAATGDPKAIRAWLDQELVAEDL